MSKFAPLTIGDANRLMVLARDAQTLAPGAEEELYAEFTLMERAGMCKPMGHADLRAFMRRGFRLLTAQAPTPDAVQLLFREFGMAVVRRVA